MTMYAITSRNTATYIIIHNGDENNWGWSRDYDEAAKFTQENAKAFAERHLPFMVEADLWYIPSNQS